LIQIYSVTLASMGHLGLHTAKAKSYMVFVCLQKFVKVVSSLNDNNSEKFLMALVRSCARLFFLSVVLLNINVYEYGIVIKPFDLEMLLILSCTVLLDGATREC